MKNCTNQKSAYNVFHSDVDKFNGMSFLPTSITK